MIPMQTNLQEDEILKDVVILCGSAHVKSVSPCKPFDDKVLNYLSAVSKRLLASFDAKSYPDVMTFAFFCRRANLMLLKGKYKGTGRRIGRGLVFHIAPSNVPVNFAYSLVAALLAGNVSVVKAPSKDFQQVRIICRVLAEMMCDFAEIENLINVVMYDRDDQKVTEYYSASANVRVIWGGDGTINSVRRAKLSPRAFDIAFADRYSIAVIDAASVIAIKENAKVLMKLAQDFYNDTYLSDQNACSSPRLIYWLGTVSDAAVAKAIFWNAIYNNIKDNYPMESIFAVNKLTAAEKTAIEIKGTIVEKSIDNRIVRVAVPYLTNRIVDLCTAGGFFHEYTAETIDDLVDIVDEKYQTLVYFGVNKENIADFVISKRLRGIDRIVPMGQSMDFSLLWDGYNLIMSMSREIF